MERSQKLRRFIDNLFEIRRHQEILRMRNKIHDVLGQQLSAFWSEGLSRKRTCREKSWSTWIEELTAQLYNQDVFRPCCGS